MRHSYDVSLLSWACCLVSTFIYIHVIQCLWVAYTDSLCDHAHTVYTCSFSCMSTGQFWQASCIDFGGACLCLYKWALELCILAFFLHNQKSNHKKAQKTPSYNWNIIIYGWKYRHTCKIVHTYMYMYTCT